MKKIISFVIVFVLSALCLPLSFTAGAEDRITVTDVKILSIAGAAAENYFGAQLDATSESYIFKSAATEKNIDRLIHYAILQANAFEDELKEFFTQEKSTADIPVSRLTPLIASAFGEGFKIDFNLSAHFNKNDNVYTVAKPEALPEKSLSKCQKTGSLYEFVAKGEDKNEYFFTASLSGENLRLISVERAIIRFSIARPPKSLYKVGEQFDPADGKIEVAYSDGENSHLIDITPQMVSGFSSETPGKKAIWIWYQHLRTNFEITVVEEPSPSQPSEPENPSDSQPPVSSSENSVQQIPADSNNRLSILTIDKGTLSPLFSSTVYSYTVTVDYSVKRLKINAASESDKATVEVRNKDLAPGKITEIEIFVTAEDGSVQTYILKVSRADKSGNYPTEPDSISLPLWAKILATAVVAAALGTGGYFLWRYLKKPKSDNV